MMLYIHYYYSTYVAVVGCTGGAVGGRATAGCTSDNPIVLRTCTVEGINTELSVIVPCTFNFT